MGELVIILQVLNAKARARLRMGKDKPNVADLSTALAQLELLKLSLLGSISKLSKITKKDYKKDD
jgi:hypothetical protein